MRDTPPDLKDNPALAQTVDTILLDMLGDTAAAAWAALAGTGASNASMSQESWKIFVRLALRDREWLGSERRDYAALFSATAEPGPANLAYAAEEAVGALVAEADRAENNDERAAVARLTVRTIELLMHAGLTGGRIDDQLFQALGRTLTPLLYDHVAGPRVVSSIGPVAEPVLAEYVLPAAVPNEPMADRPLGQRFAPEVTNWLLADAEFGFTELHADRNLIGNARYHVVADAVFANYTTASLQDRAQWAPFASIGLCRALYEEFSPDQWRSTDITPLFEQSWDINRLLWVDEQCPNAIPARFFLRSLLAAQSANELGRVAWCIIDRAGKSLELTGTPPEPDADDLAWTWALLATVNWRTVRPGHIETWSKVIEDYHRRPDVRLHVTLSVNLAITYILFRCKEFNVPPGPAVWLASNHAAALEHAVTENSRDVADALFTLIDHGVIDGYTFCVLAVLAAPGAPRNSALPPNDPLRSLLAGDRTTVDGTTIFDHVARLVMDDPYLLGAPPDPMSLAKVTRILVSAVHSVSSFELDDIARFAQNWFRGPGDRGGPPLPGNRSVPYTPPGWQR
jgi:hypothetical protein